MSELLLCPVRWKNRQTRARLLNMPKDKDSSELPDYKESRREKTRGLGPRSFSLSCSQN